MSEERFDRIEVRLARVEVSVANLEAGQARLETGLDEVRVNSTIVEKRLDNPDTLSRVHVFLFLTPCP